MISRIRFLPEAKPEHHYVLNEIDKFAFKQEATENFIRLINEKPWLYTVMERETEKGNWVASGYNVVMPINKFAKNALMNGEMSEDEITGKYITSMDDAAAIYIGSVAVDENANIYESNRLAGVTIGQVLKFEKETFAIPVSKAGERMAKEMCMVKKEFENNHFKGLNNYEPKLFSIGIDGEN